ncbi:MAG: hypothetical protein MUF34_19605 [Polyangiaceae bacterium]|nr:hypothetical protein [Polyangiaceae bacterium]
MKAAATRRAPAPEPKADLGPASPPPSALAVYEDFAVAAYDGVRVVRDLELAERLKMKKLRGIRTDIIKPLIARGGLKNGAMNGGGSAAAVLEPLFWAVETIVEGGNGAKQQVTEFWLNEAAALRVAQESETEEADRIKNALVRVFLLAKRGDLPGQRPDPTPKPQPVALPGPSVLSEAEVRAGTAAIELAVETNQIGKAEAAVHLARLIRGKLDILTLPEGVGFQRSALTTEASQALVDGRAVVLMPVPDETGVERASAIGARHGLSGQAVNDIAKEVGVHGDVRFGAWRKTYGEGGRVLNTYFVYNAEGVAAIEPKAAEAGAAKKAAAEAKARRASRQPGLPLR